MKPYESFTISNYGYKNGLGYNNVTSEYASFHDVQRFENFQPFVWRSVLYAADKNFDFSEYDFMPVETFNIYRISNKGKYDTKIKSQNEIQGPEPIRRVHLKEFDGSPMNCLVGRILVDKDKIIYFSHFYNGIKTT